MLLEYSKIFSKLSNLNQLYEHTLFTGQNFSDWKKYINQCSYTRNYNSFIGNATISVKHTLMMIFPMRSWGEGILLGGSSGAYSRSVIKKLNIILWTTEK